MKIIGLILTWNNFEFFRCALKQALDFCDEVLLVEGCHSSFYPKYSDDGTCEYIESIEHPKLRILDVGHRFDRYDKNQRILREEIPKKSQYWETGNWLFYLDDDIFFSTEDLVKIKDAIQTTRIPSFTFDVRYFFYNFRFNHLQRGGNLGYKILDDFELRGISYPCYKDGRQFDKFHIKNVTGFHYSYVKKPERMKARWAMSVEKGTESSALLFDKWMNIEWGKEADIFQQQKELYEIRPEGELNIYTREHPSVLDDHPWRNINDVREMQ